MKQREEEERRPGRLVRALRWLWFRRWVGAVVAFALVLLTVLNLTTRSMVDRREEDAREVICQRVMPLANTFSETPYVHELARSIYAGYDGSTLQGWCVETQVTGFGGAMVLMVGVDTDGKVTGVAIESHNEDPSWAEKADSAEHTGQYAGRSGTIPYGAIASVTGATTTSRAMTDGVNQALRVIAETDLEGGGAYGEEGQD